ncbi:hypothetical protein ACVI1J_008978 [Bradyrhizobium diazoefficiens]
MKLTEHEIEELASKLADIHRDSDDDDGWANAEAHALIDRLEDVDRDAVLTRCQDITVDGNIEEVFVRTYIQTARATERAVGRRGGAEGRLTLERGRETLTRLLHATGCPDDEPMLAWLEERGVAVRDEDGWHFKLPKPGAVE